MTLYRPVATLYIQVTMHQDALHYINCEPNSFTTVCPHVRTDGLRDGLFN